MDSIKIRHPGALHRTLGVKPNAMISTSRIKSELSGNPSPKLKKQLVFAENARKWG